MSKTKKVTITMTPEMKKRGKEMSINLFGHENLSGYISFLINTYEVGSK